MALPGDLQQPENWRRLSTLVQIEADDDILPVRAKYVGQSTTIGLNHLTSNKPLWFTLADCLASKFLSCKTPHILKAITFEPGLPQSGLKPVKVASHAIDPVHDDFIASSSMSGPASRTGCAMPRAMLLYSWTANNRQ